MKIKKIIGWLFLFFGVIIIIYPLFISYKIVSQGEGLPNIFSAREENQVASEKNINPSMENIQEFQKELISQQISKIIPSDYIGKLFNLIAWSIISAIFIFGGAQLGHLGIKLIK